MDLVLPVVSNGLLELLDEENQSLQPPLLVTKLSPPSLSPHIVPRPHLVERLCHVEEKQLVLLTAPAGFGKTTLLNEWRGQSQFPVAWLSLDQGENDVALFLTYCITALQTVHASLGTSLLPLLRSRSPLNIKSLLICFINEIAALPSDFILVLDDYHSIRHMAVHHAVSFLLEHLPAPLHLVISSRSIPPLPLAKLRVRRFLLEIGRADLRFTSQEISTFLTEIIGLPLSSEELMAMEARTEGWIAGLQLAALSRQQMHTQSHLQRPLSGQSRVLFDYLTEEVLGSQPPYICTFLQQTAVLDRLRGDLCDVVTGAQPGSSQIMLQKLEQANLLLAPLDEERQWYRYHPLFAEFLLIHLCQQQQPECITSLHKRAAAWYEQHDLIPEAIHHTFAADDIETTIRLIEQVAEEMVVKRGEWTTLHTWLKMLPEEIRRARRHLCLLYAWTSLFTERFETAERYLAAVEDHPDGIINEEHQAVDEGLWHSLYALLAARRGDVEVARKQIQTVLHKLPQEDWRSVIELNLGMAAAFAGDVEIADYAYTELVERSQRTSQLYVTLLALCNFAALKCAQGALQQALTLYQHGLQQAEEKGVQQWAVVGTMRIGMGRILCERNTLEQAKHAILAGIEVGRQSGHFRVLAYGLLALGEVYWAQGDIQRAYERLYEAQKLLQRKSGNVLTLHEGDSKHFKGGAVGSLPLSRQIRLALIQLKLVQGEVVAAAHLFEEYTPLFDREYLVEAYTHLVQGQSEKVNSLLQRLMGTREKSVRGRMQIEILLLQSLALAAQNHVSQALDVLERALVFAEQEHYVRIFVDAGHLMPCGTRKGISLASLLLTILSKQGQDISCVISHSYVSDILHALGYTETELLYPSKAHEPNKTNICSNREKEILRLIAVGKTNQEIADQLVLAPGTVKRHVHNLFSKLQVRNRTEAIAYARNQDLL
jgi:LuxR family maltose regulon positive regulatory protein